MSKKKPPLWYEARNTLRAYRQVNASRRNNLRLEVREKAENAIEENDKKLKEALVELGAIEE
jgi:hypothetical protein